MTYVIIGVVIWFAVAAWNEAWQAEKNRNRKGRIIY